MSNSADKLKHQQKNHKNHKLSTKSQSSEADYFGGTHSQACNDSKGLNLKGHESSSKQMQSSPLSSNGFATSAENMPAYSIDYSNHSNLSAAVATETAVRFYESVTHLTERKECTFQQEFPKRLRSKEKMEVGEVHSSQRMTTADCGQLSLKRLKVETIETNHLDQKKVTQQGKSSYNMEQWESSSSVSSNSGDDDESERNCINDDRLKSLWNSPVQPNRRETWSSSADSEMKHTNKYTQLPNPVLEEDIQAENSQERILLNPLDFHNALMNFNSYRECSNEICRLQTARAHFHCYDFACLGRKVLIRQKDLLRHIKWHRRQNKSLAHGFLRYSAGDECGGSAAGAGGIAAATAADSCQYRRRQTHYHCVQGDCARVCVSLGAAKMHANDHKIAAMTTAAAEHRDFRRYTSKENCSVEFCIFSGRKVAHFHCAHASCQFTAKTKAELEKHRAYHQSESMQYARAADSRRPERSEACAADIPQPRAARRQSEQQQRQQQQQQRQHEQCDCESRADNYDKSLSRCGSERNSMDARGSELESVEGAEMERSAAAATARATSVADKHKMRRHSDSDECESNNNNNNSSSSGSSSSTSSNIAANNEEPACSSKARHLATMEYLQKMLQQQQQLLLLQQQQELLLLQQQSNKEASAEEAKQKTRTALARTATATATTTRACAAAKDLTAVDCAPQASGLSAAAAANFYQQLASAAAAAAVDMSAVGDVAASLKSGAHPVQITSIDGFFNRKRGRPPKNRFVEVYKNTQQSPQAIFTSFKLEKHGLGNAESLENTSKVETFSATSATSERNHLSHIQKEQYQQQLLQALAAPNLEQQLTQLPFHLGREAQRVAATMASSSARAKMTSNIPTSYSKKNQIGINLSNSSIPCEEFNMLRFHQFIEDEFDCRIERCRLRKLHPHLHCRSCQQQVSPLDLKTHACAEALTLRPRAHDFAEAPASEARAEKVSVVRAAGTFYPENSSSNNDVSKPAATNSEDGKTPSNNGLTGPAPKSAASPSSCKSKRRRTEAAATEVTQKPPAQQQRPHFLAPATAAAAVAIESSEFDADMPQDLRVHAATTTTATTADAAAAVAAKAADDYKQQQQQLSLHFQQLISLYQQQQQQQMLYNATGMPAYAPPTLVPHQLPATTALLAEMSPLLAGAGGASPLNLNLVATLFETFSNAAGSAAPATETRTQTKTQSALPASQKNRSSTAGLLHKLKDDRIPTGYLKFRFNEDCGFPKCGYRNHQSHFHCNRVDCHYSFCDKTRFVQHTARHERLDTLMGDDFLQYRANMNCGHDNCPYLRTDASTSAVGIVAKKSSHFHCRKCEFICSDTNKVVAHRRLHHKMEYIRLAGFRKVACNENCKQTKGAAAEKCAENSGAAHRDEEVERCPYSMKHTHYHCLVCDCSVLSRAQLATHKHKITATMTCPQIGIL